MRYVFSLFFMLLSCVPLKDRTINSYTAIHHETRVGHFLRQINHSHLLITAIDVTADLSHGSVLKALEDIIKRNETMTDDQKDTALNHLYKDFLR